MRTATKGPITLNWFSCAHGSSGLQLSVVVKGSFSLSANGVAKPAEPPQESKGDVFFEDQPDDRSLCYPSDFAPFKPRADILLNAIAHAPGGNPVGQLDAGLRVGGFRKMVRLTGDRVWRRRFLFWNRPSAPVEFKNMPVVYERAFGGAKSKRNPVGRGRDKKKLPNVELPDHLVRRSGNRPPPAGFSAIAASWEPRRSKVGTYKGKWQKENWPWFPGDFDWGYFNAAPEDQQIEGYLRGDEDLEFVNLHPAHPRYVSRLPGLRARAFVQIEFPETPPEFREVKLNLDTLWINMEKGELVLVWRGLTPVRAVKFKEVTHVAALTEPLASPVRLKDEMREWMLQQVKEGQGQGPPTPEETAEAAEAKAAWASMEQATAVMDKERAQMESEFAAAEQELEKQWEQEKAQLIAGGVDPKLLEQPTKTESLADMKAQMADEVARLAEANPEAAAKLADTSKGLDEIADMEQEFAGLEAKIPRLPTPESIQADIAQGKAVQDAHLSGQDFSNLDLSGADFSGTDFSEANLSGAKLVGARLARANFSQANLAGADFSQAMLDRADFSGAKLAAAKFSGASVAGALFSEIQMPGADFSGCTGQHPNFSGSNLEAANFSGAKLPAADFSKANVSGANFIQAELPASDFGGVNATGVNMEKAELTNLRAGEKANFSGARFLECKAPESIWEGARLDGTDFSRAVLTGALFEDASVKGARFDRADLAKASFEDASAQKALLTNANLLRASFNRADLTEARLDGSNLYEASFWETVFHHTNIEGANLKRTLISKAS